MTQGTDSMDGSHFDTLTRSLCTAGSRRRAVGGLLTGVFGVLGWQGQDDAAAHDLKAKCKKKSGEAKKKCLKKAKKHAAQHAAELPPVTCGAGTKICNGQCIPSASCCGGCPAGTICRDSFCVLCASGETPCGNACVNRAIDPANCGRCGRTCPSGECLNGACTCGVAACPAGCTCY